MLPKKILAMKLRALGDTVILTAALEELWLKCPGSEIHLAVSAAWAPLFEGFPGIKKVWPYERHAAPAARTKAIAHLAFKLRKEKFDCVVNFHASPSSALISFATGARIRAVHFHGHKDRDRHSTVEIPGKGTLKPIIERDLDTLRSIGLPVESGRMPRLHLFPSEMNEARSLLEESGLKPPVLAIGLGASRPTKSWPLDRFARVAVDWLKQTPGGVMVTAGPDENTLISEFLGHVKKLASSELPFPERLVCRSNLPLRQLAAILGQAQVYFGNDSGPKHLAAAVGTPTVTIFGPEDPFEWHPYDRSHHPYFFIPDLACRRDADPGMPPWCGLRECTTENHRCMREIPVEPVLAECRRLAHA